MKICSLSLLLAAAAFAAPARAFAAGDVLGQAGAVTNSPAKFDGAAAKPEADPVRPGTQGDGRTAEQIAKDEQVKADERVKSANLKLGPNKEPAPPKPNEWLKSDHLIMGVKGAMVGLLVGSLWGLAGLGIGAAVGALIGYVLSRITA